MPAGGPSTQEFNDSLAARSLRLLLALLGTVIELANAVRPQQDHPALATEERICNRFHLVVRELSQRREGKPVMAMGDEYDVQDLFRGLLVLHFDNVKPEEYTPSYAGKASRIDFLLEQERIAIELKMTRASMSVGELSTQLIEDIARFKKHPGYETLVCFVYDPDRRVSNPRGVESELDLLGGENRVRTLIRPV
jgi:hypothetical protein